MTSRHQGNYTSLTDVTLPKHVWAIRVRPEIAAKARDLARFNLAIDSKLRGCDFATL